MFYCSKKPCSCEVFSADQVPLRKPLHVVHTHEFCKYLEYFGEIAMENLSYTLFLQFLRNVSRSQTAVKRCDPGCRCCARAAACLPPCSQSSALVLLNEPSHGAGASVGGK